MKSNWNRRAGMGAQLIILLLMIVIAVTSLFVT
jgi:hypothetical protein